MRKAMDYYKQSKVEPKTFNGEDILPEQVEEQNNNQEKEEKQEKQEKQENQEKQEKEENLPNKNLEEKKLVIIEKV